MFGLVVGGGLGGRYLFDCGVVYSGLVNFGCCLCIWLLFVLGVLLLFIVLLCADRFVVDGVV